MTPEEYQRLKEAEKEHLRKLKELKNAVRQLERQKRVGRAIEGITETPRDLLDENAGLVEQLAMETARSEAKLDIALETAAEKDAGRPAESAAEQDARYEEDLRKERARQLLQQLRDEVGAASAAAPVMPKAAASKTSAPETAPLPEKTIGRMKP